MPSSRTHKPNAPLPPAFDHALVYVALPVVVGLIAGFAFASGLAGIGGGLLTVGVVFALRRRRGKKTSTT